MQPPVATPTPRPSSGRWLVLISAIVVGVIGVVAVLAILSGDDGFPDTVLGLERLRGGDADRAEDTMEGLPIGDLEIHAAVYGVAESPRLVATVFGNLPREGANLETMMRGAIASAEASGGTVVERSL